MRVVGQRDQRGHDRPAIRSNPSNVCVCVTPPVLALEIQKAVWALLVVRRLKNEDAIMS